MHMHPLIVQKNSAATHEVKLGSCTADCFVPEFWVTTYPPSTPAGAGLRCMVGFIAGEAASAAAAMRQSEVVRKALAQLDTMFGDNNVS